MTNVVYKRLKEAAETGSYTVAQVEAVTKQQIAGFIGIDAAKVSDGMFVNAKAKLLREMERKKWQAALDGLKAQLIGGGRVWLKNNFPDAEFAVDHRRKTVTIFFEGIPKEVE